MLDPVQLPTEYGEAGATLGGHRFQLRCLQVVVGWVYQKWGWATGECHGGMSCVIKVDSDNQKWSPPAMLQQDRGRIFFFFKWCPPVSVPEECFNRSLLVQHSF